MHHTAVLILQVLEDHFPQNSPDKQRIYRKLRRLVSDLGIEAAELEAQVKAISRFDDVA